MRSVFVQTKEQVSRVHHTEDLRRILGLAMIFYLWTANTDSI